MFSQAPTSAWTGKGGASSATTRMAASTAAAPAMSPFMVTMPSVGLSESPPGVEGDGLAHQDERGRAVRRAPGPAARAGAATALLPGRLGSQESFTSRGSSAEPRVTPRNMPIFRRASSRGPSTSQRSPAPRASASASRASWEGVQWRGASLTRSRAQATASATSAPNRTSALPAAGVVTAEPATTTRSRRAGGFFRTLLR